MKMAGKRACDRCSAIKQSCSGNNPCERCIRLDEPCTYDRPFKPVGRPSSRIRDGHKSTGINTTDQIPHITTTTQSDQETDILSATDSSSNINGSINSSRSKVTKSITRSRSGCLSCRIRKKKCDETWPQCGDCRRLNRKCSGPVDASRKTFDRLRQEQQSEDDAYDGNTCLTLPASGADDDEADEISRVVNNSDLLTQEMEIVNRDTAITNNGIVHSSSSPPLWSAAAATPLSRPLTALQVDAAEKELLTYFKDIVVPILFMRQRLTKVSESVLPLCFQYKQVRYPILGIAAAHRAGRDPGFFLDYMCYKDKAQKSADLALKSDTEESMLSLLMMVYLEVLDGLSTNWSYYLERVFQRMNRGPGETTTSYSSDIYEFIKQTFYYLDFVSSLSTCNPPFTAKNRQNAPQDQYIPECSPVRLGLCGELGSILGDISTLSSMRNLRSQHFILEDQFNSFAEFIEIRLNKLTLPSESSPRPEGICEGEHLNFILTWKWAALMRLHQIQQGYDKRHPRVYECLANLLCSLRAIEEGSPLECGLIFPLIMSGAAAVNMRDQEYIVHRVRCLKNQLGFGYVDQVEKMLQTIWAREEKTRKPVNWASVRYYEFSGIVMI